ncbi:hypothetical protein BV501_18770 [Erwinia sp. OAMSP11]|nr:hypothetical protein BV501_18770 [Erwinia sp. OAMSP11]PIJ63882.1 hypothetical protein BK416_17955 [Erwinia sp. OLSSP12]PIJ76528.1 hypothetical protein BLD46_18405 [Erwinia sp. OLMTSP26]
MFCLTAARDGQTKPLGQDSVPTPFYRAPLVHSARNETMKKPRSEKRRKTELLTNVRCHDEEKTLIVSKAEAKGISLGAYIRDCAMRRTVKEKGDASGIDAIVALGARQKQIYQQIKAEGMTPELDAEFSKTLRELKTALENFTPS